MFDSGDYGVRIERLTVRELDAFAENETPSVLIDVFWKFRG